MCPLTPSVGVGDSHARRIWYVPPASPRTHCITNSPIYPGFSIGKPLHVPGVSLSRASRIDLLIYMLSCKCHSVSDAHSNVDLPHLMIGVRRIRDPSTETSNGTSIGVSIFLSSSQPSLNVKISHYSGWTPLGPELVLLRISSSQSF